ncbi:hypothetical protein EJB05_33669, partial [Eragrostis curvula]
MSFEIQERWVASAFYLTRLGFPEGGDREKGASDSGVGSWVPSDVGHVVCSQCRNKLKSPNECHSQTSAIGNGQGSPLKELNCKIVYSQHELGSSRPGNGDLVNYYLRSKFRVACTDFSEGLPNLDSRFKIVVPNVALEKNAFT